MILFVKKIESAIVDKEHTLLNIVKQNFPINNPI